MTPFVVDVSACMPWCCEDEATPQSDQLIQRARAGEVLHVPSIWSWELVNAVGVGVKRQRITPEHAFEFFKLLASFNIVTAETPRVEEFPHVYQLAQRHRLSAYDAAYLDLALRHDLPLATLDSELILAARAEGVAVLGSAPLDGAVN